MVLFAGVGTVLAFILISKLRPGKKPKVLFDRATDNRFYLVLEETDAAFDVKTLRSLFERFNVVHIEERVESGSGKMLTAEVVL
jgi:hypothetical protein